MSSSDEDKHKQGARRNALRLKPSSDDMVTRQLGKVIHELTIYCEGGPYGKDRHLGKQKLISIKRCH